MNSVAVDLLDSSTEKKNIQIPKKNVLDEETYVQELEAIIERDFFPDLTKLKAQKEYLEAVEKNDVILIRELIRKYSQKSGFRPGTSFSSSCDTPQTFDTPAAKPTSPGSNTPATKTDDFDNTIKIKDETVKASVDNFLAKNTSEDNASFSQIIETNDERFKEKYKWLYDKEKEHFEKHQEALALTSGDSSNDKLALTSSVDNWTYTNKNTLMYVPDGVEMSMKEKMDLKPGREIQHKNTRFAASPFNEATNQSAITQGAAVQAKAQEGKIGVDGKEIVVNSTPNVNGFKFVQPSPSPAPGVTESPLITWGEIEGTPFRLDGSDTPIRQGTPSSGPSFRIPKVPTRDRLAHDLAENASKKHRAKKRRALDQVRDRLQSSSPIFSSTTPRSPFDQLGGMSPAAQALANKKLGISKNTDKSLRASYTPSPKSRTVGGQTPKIRKNTEQSKRPSSAYDTKKTPDALSSGITDNLLKLKRFKASDFF